MVAQDLQYEPETIIHGVTEYTAIAPQGQSAFPIAASGGTVTQFQWIPGTWNPYQDELQFDIATVPVAGLLNSNVVHNVPPIREMRITTASGTTLMDYRFADKMMDQLGLACTSKEEVQRYLPHSIIQSTLATPGGAAGELLSVGAYVAPGVLCGDIAQTATVNVAALNTPLEYLGMTPGRCDGTGSAKQEPPWRIVSTDQAANGAGPGVLQYAIKLRYFPRSFWETDLTIQVKEPVYLDITWGQPSLFVWQVLTAGGTGAFKVEPGAAVQQQHVLDVSNVRYIQAKETNPAVIASLSEQISSANGLKFLIPYVWSLKNSVAQTTNPTITQNFTISQGLRLMEVWTIVHNSTETVNNAYDHAFMRAGDPAARRVTNFYTLLNGKRVGAIYNYRTEFHDAWTALEDHFHGSCLDNEDTWLHKWVWVDKFDAKRTADKHTMLDGIPLLDGALRHEFNATTVANTAYSIYQHAVFCREVTVRDSGITIR
jgi:hypothetical protein